MNWSSSSWEILLIAVLGIAVVTDLRQRKIPNWLTFSAMAIGLAYQTNMRGWEGMLFSLKGLGLGMALLAIPYLMGGMGAGDVKLLGAIGAFLGPQGVFGAFLLSALVGGLYAIILLLFHGFFIETVRRYWMMVKTFFLTWNFIYLSASPQAEKPRLLYGVAIALGTFLSLGVRIPSLGT